MALRCAHRLSFAVVIGLSVLLSACVGDRGRPPPRADTAPKAASSAEIRACYASLEAAGLRFRRLPDHRAGNCGYNDALQLLDFGIPTTNLTALSCPLASRFAAWVRHGVDPAARLALGSPVARVETFGSYACRSMIGNGSGQISQHAFANAVDVGAFVLADGRRITVKAHWKNGGQEGRFLDLIHQSACKRFRTVLSPDYNAAHADHLHVDLGGRGTYCR